MHQQAAPSVIAAWRREYRAVCRHHRLAFVWHLEKFRKHHECKFWALFCPRPSLPEPSLTAFCSHFAHVFGSFRSSPMPPDLCALLNNADFAPFTTDEVCEALVAMAAGKTTGLGAYPVDFLRGMHDTRFYDVVADMFSFFAVSGYPTRLNTLLMMPLFKNRGDKGSPDNYRGISLIHPLGRWFAKCLVRRLEGDPGATRAVGQSGFCKGYRTEDASVLL